MSRHTKKAALSTQIDARVLAEVRAAVVTLSGPPDRLTIASLIEDALVRQLQRLRRQRNNSKPFKAAGRPRPGRPIG